jgi:RNA polymerase sigma factor (sigma-70 family)
MSDAMMPSARDEIPTRYSLLSRLQNWDDQDSWRDFFDTYWRLIYAMALKSGLTESEAEDVVQETIISVAKDLHKFERDRKLGSFKGWLRNVIRWRIADQLRKRTRAVREETQTGTDGIRRPSTAEIPDPACADAESIWEKEWQESLLKAAMDKVKHRVKEEYYQMFDLYVVKGWPAKKVAQTLGVHTGQVYLAKHRVAALIKLEVRKLEKKWH